MDRSEKKTQPAKRRLQTSGDYRRIPFRFFLLANHVSICLRQYYSKKYKLGVNGWRTMALLANLSPISAKEVSYRNGMDKVRVTRTIDRLVELKFVSRSEDPADRRRILLALTPSGRTVYESVVPVARNIEKSLLKSLTQNEAQTLQQILDKLEARCDVIFDEEHSVDPFVDK